jgi:hypothetical protein
VWVLYWIRVVFVRGLVVEFDVFGAGSAVPSALRVLQVVGALCWFELLFVCSKW